MEHVHYTEHFVVLRAAVEDVAGAYALQPLSSFDLLPFRPLFPGRPHALIAVPASPAVLSL